MSGTPRPRHAHPRPIYSCPPDQRGQAPWCSGLPCTGHRATVEQMRIARILAYLAGVELYDPHPDMELLRTARQLEHAFRAEARA